MFGRNKDKDPAPRQLAGTKGGPALEKELAKDKPDMAKLRKLTDQVVAEALAEAEKTLTELATEKEKVKKLEADLKTLRETPDQSSAKLEDAEAKRDAALTELAELKEKLAETELIAKDPNAAKMRRINEGRFLEVPVEDDSGKRFMVKFQFKTSRFAVPGHGELSAVQILNNPDRYQKVIARLVERKSPLLVEVSRKPLKKGGK